MSTLKASNIQDTSGNNNSTPAEISQGRAKAWAYFDGTGTPSVVNGYNVDTIDDGGDGKYTLNFTTAMANANYCPVSMSVKSSTQTQSRHCTYAGGTKSTTQLQVELEIGNGTNYDLDTLFVAVFGD
jgi:hypothetical protein|tara:strand:- start:1265 stop:1645 length:381 start_codon:yes stop_codon:yes gene_type:complete